jgi:hypothetical protein
MNPPLDLAAMSGEEMETEETPAAISAQTPTPEDQFLAFPDWLARNTGDGSSEIERRFAADPLAKYRDYSDYSRRTLLKQGRWNDELPQLIDSRLVQLAIDSGDYAVEEGQEVDISAVLAKPPGAEFDLDALISYGVRNDDEAVTKAAAMAKAIEQRKLDGDVFPDYDIQSTASLATVREVVTPDVLSEMTRQQVKRGEKAAALLPPADPKGEPELLVSEELLAYVNPEDGSIDTRALAEHLSSRNTDPGLISGVLFKLSRPEGFKATRMEIEKQYDLMAQLELARATPNAEAGERIGELFKDRSDLDRERLKADKGTFRVNTLLEEALEGAQNYLDLDGGVVDRWDVFVSGRNPTRAFEHIAFELRDALRGTPMGDLPEEQFNDLIMDYIKRNVDEKWEGKDPATVLKTLSTGEVVAPFSLMLQKDKFDQALRSVPVAQQAKLRAEQEYTVEANARSVADVIINAPEGGDKFLRFMEQEQAKGKTLGQITQDWASQGNYTGAMSRARGVGYSVLDAAGVLVFTLPALMGNETSLKNLQAIQAKKSSSRAYAELIGGDVHGFGQDLLELIAPVVADLLVSRGVATAATTTARTTARSAMRNMMVSSLSSETKTMIGTWTKGAASRALVAEGATKAAAPKVVNVMTVDQVVSAAGRDITRQFGTGVGYAAFGATAFNRSAGMTYASLSSAFASEKNPDGSRKFTDEEVREKALGPSLLAGSITAATVYGFQFLGKAGMEKYVLNKGLTNTQLSRIHSRLSKDIGNLPKTMEGIDMATAQTMLKSAMKKGYTTMWSSPVMTGLRHEGMEEGTDEFINSFVEAHALDENRPLWEHAKDALHGAALGGVMGGTISGVGSAMQNRRRIASNTEAEIRRARLLDVATALDSTSPQTARVLRNYAANQRTTVPQIARLETQLAQLKREKPTEARPAEMIEAERQNIQEKLVQLQERAAQDPADTLDPQTDAPTATPTEAPATDSQQPNAQEDVPPGTPEGGMEQAPVEASMGQDAPAEVTPETPATRQSVEQEFDTLVGGRPPGEPMQPTALGDRLRATQRGLREPSPAVQAAVPTDSLPEGQQAPASPTGQAPSLGSAVPPVAETDLKIGETYTIYDRDGNPVIGTLKNVRRDDQRGLKQISLDTTPSDVDGAIPSSMGTSANIDETLQVFPGVLMTAMPGSYAEQEAAKESLSKKGTLEPSKRDFVTDEEFKQARKEYEAALEAHIKENGPFTVIPTDPKGLATRTPAAVGDAGFVDSTTATEQPELPGTAQPRKRSLSSMRDATADRIDAFEKEVAQSGYASIEDFIETREAELGEGEFDPEVNRAKRLLGLLARIENVMMTEAQEARARAITPEGTVRESASPEDIVTIAEAEDVPVKAVAKRKPKAKAPATPKSVESSQAKKEIIAALEQEIVKLPVIPSDQYTNDAQRDIAQQQVIQDRGESRIAEITTPSGIKMRVVRTTGALSQVLKNAKAMKVGTGTPKKPTTSFPKTVVKKTTKVGYGQEVEQLSDERLAEDDSIILALQDEGYRKQVVARLGETEVTQLEDALLAKEGVTRAELAGEAPAPTPEPEAPAPTPPAISDILTEIPEGYPIDREQAMLVAAASVSPGGLANALNASPAAADAVRAMLAAKGVPDVDKIGVADLAVLAQGEIDADPVIRGLRGDEEVSETEIPAPVVPTPPSDPDFGIKDKTPMMVQYLALRKALPEDIILLYRLGDFYEMFGNDAKRAAPILEVALTKRGNNPMAGIPYHALQGQIENLVKAGYRVALAEQAANSKPGQLVEREITEVIPADPAPTPTPPADPVIRGLRGEPEAKVAEPERTRYNRHTNTYDADEAKKNLPRLAEARNVAEVAFKASQRELGRNEDAEFVRIEKMPRLKKERRQVIDNVEVREASFPFVMRPPSSDYTSRTVVLERADGTLSGVHLGSRTSEGGMATREMLKDGRKHPITFEQEISDPDVVAVYEFNSDLVHGNSATVTQIVAPTPTSPADPLAQSRQAATEAVEAMPDTGANRIKKADLRRALKNATTLKQFIDIATAAEAGGSIQFQPGTGVEADLNALGLQEGTEAFLKNVAAKGPKHLRGIAKLLLEVGAGNTRVALVDLPNTGAAGFFVPSTGVVHVNTAKLGPRGPVDTLVHELLHAATDAAIRNPNAAQAPVVKRLDRVRKSVQKKLNTPADQYATSNLDEFLTHFLTDPAFRDRVSRMTPKSERNWVQVIADFITDLIHHGRARTQAEKASDQIRKDMLALIQTPEPGLNKGRMLNQLSPDAQNVFVFNELTADLPANPTQADLDTWREANPEKYERLKAMRETVLRDAGYDVGPVYHGTRGDRKGNFPFTAFEMRIGRNTQGEDAPVAAAYFSENKNVAAGAAASQTNMGRKGRPVVGEFLLKDVTRRPDVETDIEYRVTDPAQIKSTEPLNLDDSGTLITPDRWADAGSPDIRFQLSEDAFDFPSNQQFNETIDRYITGEWNTPEQQRTGIKQFIDRYIRKQNGALVSAKGWAVATYDRGIPGANERAEASTLYGNPTTVYFSVDNLTRSAPQGERDAKRYVAKAIEEELIHAAHIQFLAESAPEGVTLTQEDIYRNSAAVFSQMIDRVRREGDISDSIQKALASSMEIYGVGDFNELVRISRENDFQKQYEVVNEFTRQLVQIGNGTLPTELFEAQNKSLFDAIITWFKERFAALKWANDNLNLVSPLLKENVEGIQRVMRGSDIRFQLSEDAFAAVTPEQDAAYLEAVERGDMATAQRMVDEAAKAAGYNRKGIRFGFYVDGVPLPPSISGQSNFGPGYYVAEDAKVDISGGDVSVSPTPNKKDLEKLGLREDQVEFISGPVFVKAQNPFPRESNLTESERKFIEASIAYESSVNDAYIAISGKIPFEGMPAYLKQEELVRLRGGDGLAASIKGTSGDHIKWQNTIAKLIRDKQLPYDSMRGIGGRTYSGGMSSELVVQHANQLKSADPVTYDNGGNAIPLSQRFNPQSPDIRFQLSEDAFASADPFYSQLQRVVEAKIPARATPDQIMATIDPTRGSGVKAEEIKWSGIEQALQSLAVDGKVEKAALLAYLADEGSVRFEEVVAAGPDKNRRIKAQEDLRRYLRDEKGYNAAEADTIIRGTDEGENYYRGSDMEIVQRIADVIGMESSDGTATKFGQYVLPGGRNYREVVLAMPVDRLAATTGFEVVKNSTGRTLGTFGSREAVDRYLDSIMETDGEGVTVREKQTTEDKAKVPQYTSTHFPDVPNYVAHMRTNERTDAEGREGLFIEELQSDRHQAGRKRGYAGDKASEIEAQKAELLAQETDQSRIMADLEPLLTWNHNGMDVRANGYMSVKVRESGRWETYSWDSRRPAEFNAGLTEERGQAYMDFMEAKDRRNEFARKAGNLRDEGIPDAPFRTTWPLAMFKRALRDAVEGGKEWVGFTTAQPHTDRWGTERIEWAKQPDGSFLINAKSQHGGNAGGIDLEGEADARNLNPQNSKTVTTEAQLVEAIRPSLTEGQNPEALGTKLWKRMQTEGSGVSMPRKEGFEGFYDSMLPKEIGKYVKQWGGKVEKGTVSQADDSAVAQQNKLPNYLNGGNWGVFIGSDLKQTFADEDTAKRVAGKANGSYRLLKGRRTPIWRIDITPAMRESIHTQGQALFQLSPDALPESAFQPNAIRETAIGFMPEGADPDALGIDYDTLAEDVADLDPVNAESYVRSTVNHALAREAGRNALADSAPVRENFESDEAFDAAQQDFEMDVEQLTNVFEKVTKGTLTSRDLARYKANPNALQRLITYLTEAIRSLHTRITATYTPMTAMHINRMVRELAAAKTGYRDLSTSRGYDPSIRFQLSDTDATIPDIDTLLSTPSAKSGFRHFYDGDPELLASADKPLSDNRFMRWLQTRYARQHGETSNITTKAKVNHDALMRAAEATLESMGTKARKAFIDEGADSTLIGTALGNTAALLTPNEETRINEEYDSEVAAANEQVEQDFKEAIDNATLAKDKALLRSIRAEMEAERSNAHAEADSRRMARVAASEHAEAEQRRADQRKALAELQRTSPDTFEAVIEIRRYINDFQRAASELLTDFPELQAKINGSLNIYLVRSYQIHQDPKLMKSMLDRKGDPNFVLLRDTAIEFFIPKAEAQIMAELERNVDFISGLNKQYEGDYSRMREAMDLNAKELAQERAILLYEDWITGHQSGGDFGGGSPVANEIARYMKKKNVPQELRDALMENTDPLFNALNTAQSLTRLVFNQQLLNTVAEQNLELGNFVTQAEKESGVSYVRGREVMRDVFSREGNDGLKQDIISKVTAAYRPALERAVANGTRTDPMPEDGVTAIVESALTEFGKGDVTLAELLPELGRNADRLINDIFVKSDQKSPEINTQLQPQKGKFSNWQPVVDDKTTGMLFRPLHGLYASPEQVEAFKATFQPGKKAWLHGAQKDLESVNRFILGGAGLSLGIMTLGSTSYYVRNLAGGIFYTASNGVNFLDPKVWEAAGRFTQGALGPKGEVTQEFQELLAGRVALDGAKIGYMRQLFEDISQDPAGGMKKLMEISGMSDEKASAIMKSKDAAHKGTKKFLKALGALAEFTEVLPAVMVYADFKTKLTEAEFGTEAEIRQEASRLTKMVMPSKSEASAAVDAFTRSGFGAMLGAYIRFKVETIRNTANTFRVAKEWMGSDNPTLRKYGMRKMAAFAGVYGVISTMLPLIIRRMFMGDDEEDAIRAALPRYLQNSTLYFYKPRGGDGVQVINMTYTIPMSVVTDPFSRTADALFSGQVSELPAIWARAITEDLLGENIVFGSIVDARRNRDASTDNPIYLESDSDTVKTMKAVKHIFDSSYKPRTATQIGRLKEALESDTSNAPYQYTPAGTVLNMFAPVRPITLKYEDIERRAFNDLRRQSSEAWRLTSRINSPIPVSEAEMVRMLNRRDELHTKLNAELYRRAQGAIALRGGGSNARRAVEQSMVDAGISKRRAKLILNGRSESFILGKEQMEKLAPERRATVERFFRSRPPERAIGE